MFLSQQDLKQVDKLQRREGQLSLQTPGAVSDEGAARRNRHFVLICGY